MNLFAFYFFNLLIILSLILLSHSDFIPEATKRKELKTQQAFNCKTRDEKIIRSEVWHLMKEGSSKCCHTLYWLSRSVFSFQHKCSTRISPERGISSLSSVVQLVSFRHLDQRWNIDLQKESLFWKNENLNVSNCFTLRQADDVQTKFTFVANVLEDLWVTEFSEKKRRFSFRFMKSKT